MFKNALFRKVISTILVCSFLLSPIAPAVGLVPEVLAAGDELPATLKPRYQVLNVEYRQQMGTFDKYNAKYTIKNTSNFDWGRGAAEVRFATRWVDSKGQFEPWQEVMTHPVILAKGESKVIRQQIVGPWIPGQFKLVVDPILADKHWFSGKGAALHSVDVKVSGRLKIARNPLSIVVNDNAKFTNDPNLTVKFSPSHSNDFRYAYARGTTGSVDNIKAGKGAWSKWNNTNNGQVTIQLQDKSVGYKDISLHFRGLKVPMLAKGHTMDKLGKPTGYGYRPQLETDVYLGDEQKIFFDNKQPKGQVQINDGAARTTSRIGNIKMSANDTIDGVSGSGIAAIRYSVNCKTNNLGANNWSGWQKFSDGPQQVSRTWENVSLGGGSTITVCVQVKDRAGNVKTLVDTINFYVPFTPPTYGGGEERNPDGSVKGADHKDPFGGIYGNTTAWAELELDRHFPGDANWIDQGKETDIKRAEKLYAPAITYAQTAEDGSKVTVYGVAMPKNHPLHLSVWNEYKDNCNLINRCEGHWEHHYRQAKAQHVKIVFWEDTGNGWNYLGELWNDNSNGRWQKTFNLGNGLNVGDKIVTETQLYGDYGFTGLKWWPNTTEDVNFNLSDIFWNDRGVGYWGSGGSGRYQVPPRWISDPALRAITQKEDEIGGAVRDGGMTEWCGIKHINYHSLNGHGDSVIMYNPGHEKAYLISGDLWWSYYAKGGCNRFGVPTGDGKRAGGVDAWYQTFAKADIYFGDSDPKTRPGIVEGKIREHFNYWQGTWNFLRLPENEQWATTSSCGVSGYQQHFQGGKVFSSYFGNYDIPYTNGWFDKHNEVGGVGITGWPKGVPHNVGPFHDKWEFEKGTLHWQNGNAWFDNVGCNSNVGRENDPDNAAAEIIRRKEDQSFAVFERINGGSGDGAVHSWQCGGQTVWLVDYDSITTTYGAQYGHSVVMVNGNNAYLMNGPTLYYYFDTGGCVYGKPNRDIVSSVKPEKHGNPKIDWQTFDNATLVHDWGGGTVDNATYLAAVEMQMNQLLAEAGYDVGAQTIIAGLGVPGWGETDNNRHTVHVSGGINQAYSTLRANDSDRVYVNGYLGVPVSLARHYNQLQINGETLTNVYAQEFQGGYIVQQGDSYVQALSEAGLDLLRKDIGPTPLEYLEAFVKGLIEGAKGLLIIESFLDILDIALNIAGFFVTGPLSIVVTGLEILVGIIQIVQAINELAPSLEYILSGDDPLLIWSFAGTLIGGVAIGIIGDVSITKLFKKVFGQTDVLADIGKSLTKLKKSIPSSQIDVLEKLVKNAEDVTVIQSVIKLLDSNPDIAKHIKGSIDGLSDVEIKKLYQLAEKLDEVQVDELAPILGNILGDISKLSKRYTLRLVELAQSGKKVDADDLFTELSRYIGKGLDVESPNFKLKYLGQNEWVSPAGVKYGVDPGAGGSRIDHILKHTVDDPKRPLHSFFTVSKNETFEIIDEAFNDIRLFDIRPVLQDSGNLAYYLDKAKIIGVEGGKFGSGDSLEFLKIIVDPNDHMNIISAYPVKSYFL